jgi:hypothetical protein
MGARHIQYIHAKLFVENMKIFSDGDAKASFEWKQKLRFKIQKYIYVDEIREKSCIHLL